MSRTEEGTERGTAGTGTAENTTRQRLWIFVGILLLTFVVVLAVAFL